MFGSILTPRFNEESDVDFSVNFDADKINREGLDWVSIFFDFMHELEELFGRRIDLVCDDAVKIRFSVKNLTAPSN